MPGVVGGLSEKRILNRERKDPVKTIAEARASSTLARGSQCHDLCNEQGVGIEGTGQSTPKSRERSVYSHFLNSA